MTHYRLKKGVENFQVVDGPFAGRKFVRGKIYNEVPPEEKGKFEKIEKNRSPSTVHRSSKKRATDDSERITDN